MDPLSITASALTLAGACRKLVAGFKWVRDLSNVPKEITAVSAELGDLQQVLTAVGIVTSRRTDDVYEVLLSPLFEKVEHILEELCAICGACSKRLKHDAKYGESLKVELLARLRWTRQRARIGEQQERLKVLRLDFANQLAAITLLDLAVLKSDLKALSSNAAFSDANSTLVTTNANDEKYDLKAKLGNMQMRAPLTVKRLPKQTPIIKDNDALQIIRRCSCACHTITRIKTPEMLHKAFGSLLIKSNGLYGSPACNEFSCRCYTPSRIQISYRFPEWFLHRLISSVIISNRLEGPQFSLSMPRIIPYESKIFSHARSGNVEGIMSLFQSGLAAPSDVNDCWGYSALHYAVDNGHIDVCKFLLTAGARADVRDQDENSATDLAWNQICLRKIPPATAAAFEDLFAKDLWFEARQFTILHKIVLDQLPTPRYLDQELAVSTALIDVVDSEGRTPLSWAAEVGNVEAVKTLLSYSASTSKATIIGMTPLHYAARGPDPTCMAVLLRNGASATALNKWSQGALSLAAYFQHELEYFRLLLNHGADINETDCYGSTPMFTKKLGPAAYLISRGADINHRDNDGRCPLGDAIESSTHDVISLFLKHGADLSATDSKSGTILHDLAISADLTTLQIFLDADLNENNLPLPDVNAKNSRGQTATDLMVDYHDTKTPELETALQQLILRMDVRGDASTVMFYDALEDQQQQVPLPCNDDLNEIKVMVGYSEVALEEEEVQLKA